MKYEPTADFAASADDADPLRPLREKFHLPAGDDGAPLIYFCGNSLGLQPKHAARLVEEELEDWQRLAVQGHLQARRPWLPYHEQLAAHTAELAGAEPLEVVSMNTLTVNLHLMMVSFYRPVSERYRLLIEKPAFPSDRYAAESQVRFHGFDPAGALIEIGPREGEEAIREADLMACIEREGKSIALVLLPGVQYYSGQAFDMAAITRLARAQGCMVGFDLAHAIGNLPLELHGWGADFAVWCSYKYLNGGPGAVAGCFVHARHARQFELPRFAGWWGHDKATRFRMGPTFSPLPGAEGWQLSNPPILSLAPVIASLEIFHQAGMAALRRKALALTGYLEYLLRERCADRIRMLTPTAAEARGCQLSLKLAAGLERGPALFAELEASGIVADWREPDVIRVAPVPLYNSFDEVYRFVDSLQRLLNQYA
ncbi:MAG: kynureninase [Gammaproteobacteria bacterium]|nr:kynureninase [Gammaproteobacteria bacterium]